MCDEEIARSFKQRFKGIENFLRRVAFNLGNSASQTEVKIISCIPIDVTDLQQKIVNLEKELQDVKCSNKNITSGDVPKREKVEKTTAFNASVPETCLKSLDIHDSKIHLDQQSVKTDRQKGKNIFVPQKDSDVSFVFSALSLGSCGERSKTIADTQQSVQQRKRRNIFRRKRKGACVEKNNPKTQLVYYTEAPNPPFMSRSLKQQEKPQTKKDIFNAHLSSIMRKQYDPSFGLEELSDTSQFTRPICRDNISPARYDSDMCSCCYGGFQNVDKYMGNVGCWIENGRSRIKPKDFNKTFYDSKFYDIVPVREESESSEKKHQKTITKTCNTMDMNWHKTVRNKPPFNPITLNYNAETLCHQKTRQHIYNNEPLASHARKQKHMLKNNEICNESSRSFSVNCGSIYTKRVLSPKITMTLDQAKSNKRESRITLNINSKDNLGKMSKSIQLEVGLLNDATKTETMLNQIKNILQSVLTEVKTNTQLNKGETAKKDVMVQKGTSDNNIPEDSVNSFAYTTPNLTYYSPYSQPYVPFGQLCFDNIPCQPVKCVQNSPYFMQSCQGRCKCSCQRRNTSFYKCEKPHTTAAATNTHTNTLTTETNNLIQEIYKSVALNLDYVPKYSSTNGKSETDLKSTNYESEAAKTDKEIEALLSMCTETSSQSVEKDTKETITEDKQTNLESNLYHLYRLEERKNKKNFHQTSDLEDTCDEERSEQEDHSTVIIPQRFNEKNKKGIFNKIAKFLKRRKVSHHNDNAEDEVYESSDESETEDYETVCSDSGNGSQANNSPPQKPIYKKKPPRINIQVNGKRIRRSPYVEQEYRRHWNEDSSFGEKDQKCGLDQPGTSNSMRYQQKYAPYQRTFEARSVLLARDNNLELGQKRVNVDTKEKIGFLKKHKLGLRCGENWKNLILEN